MSMAVVVASLVILALLQSTVRLKVPSGPVACGIALLIPTLGLAAWLYLVSTVTNDFYYLIVCLVSLPVFALWAGWVAARTSEDTAIMNAKIVSAVAFIPYAFITYLAFFPLPAYASYFALFILVPCILLGAKLYVWKVAKEPDGISG